MVPCYNAARLQRGEKNGTVEPGRIYVERRDVAHRMGIPFRGHHVNRVSLYLLSFVPAIRSRPNTIVAVPSNNTVRRHGRDRSTRRPWIDDFRPTDSRRKRHDDHPCSQNLERSSRLDAFWCPLHSQLAICSVAVHSGINAILKTPRATRLRAAFTLQVSTSSRSVRLSLRAQDRAVPVRESTNPPPRH